MPINQMMGSGGGGGGDYNSTVEPCMNPADTVEDSNCTYSTIEFSKVGGDHKNSLTIDTLNARDTKSITYSVVSGRLGHPGQSTLHLRVNGIRVEDCKGQHENGVVTILDPDNQAINQDVDNKIVTGFQYSNFLDLLMSWKKPVMKFPVLIQTCRSVSHIEVVAYSDLKFEISLKVKLSVGNKGELGFDFTGSGALSCDDDNAKVELELGYNAKRDDQSLDQKLSLKFEVKYGSLALGANSKGGTLKELAAASSPGGFRNIARTFQEVILIPKIVYYGVQETNKVLKGLTEAKDKIKGKRAKLTWELSKGVDIDAATYWMEDPDSFDVGRLWELKISGLIFGAKWTWDFTNIVLSTIPWVGKIIGYINDQTMERGYGGIALEISCSGEVRLKEAFHVKRLEIKGSLKKLEPESPSLLCSLNFSLKATGKIQINVKTMYIASGEASTGVSATFKKGDGISIYNNAFVIKSVITKVKCSGEKNNTVKNIDPAKLPPGCKESPIGGNKSYTIFKKKQIFDF